MENLSKALFGIYIKVFLILIVLGVGNCYIFSCIGLGPCIYKNKYTDIPTYNDACIFFDPKGVKKICTYEEDCAESETFDIKTLNGDNIIFNLSIQYNIDPSMITKMDILSYCEDKTFSYKMLNKDTLGYAFKTEVGKIKGQGRTISEIKNEINSIFEKYVNESAPAFVGDLKVRIELTFIE